MNGLEMEHRVTEGIKKEQIILIEGDSSLRLVFGHSFSLIWMKNESQKL